ncbi:hypothetical protein RB653_007220 [Dictyostelium firmibasis]|uniref:NIF3-like protein 1 n=1 Tax=Dictyostelium firmibasis TaxID=79012 RepID=A0AAN7YUG7_9MYCE
MFKLIKTIKQPQQFKYINRMSTNTSVKGKEVLKKLGELIPLNLAEKWDNVGLLIEPSNTDSMNIESIFLTNDLTEPVLQEAINEGANFIFSYHPPLFNQFKTVNQKSIPQRIAIKSIENKIPVYSPHSALDSCDDGLNDWIANGLIKLNSGRGRSKPITPYQEPLKSTQKISIYLHSNQPLTPEILKQLELNSNFQFFTTDKIELSCNQQQLLILTNLIQSFSNEIKGWDIVNQEKVSSLNNGSGKLVTLDEGIDIDVVIKGVKELFNIEYVRLGKPLSGESKKIKTISLCAGSGGSVIFGEKADLYLTGELTHHAILDACAKGSYVIVCDHTNSERGYLSQILKPNLEKLFDNRVKVLISKLDTDPLKVI